MWQPIEWKGYLNYENDFPEHLYRYRSINIASIDRLIDFELCEEGIFLAGLGDLNDPSEGRFLIEFCKDREKILKFFLNATQSSYPDHKIQLQVAQTCTRNVILSNYKATEDIAKNIKFIFDRIFRVACFTERPLNTPMWAHYAKYIDGDNSKERGGICIEYKIDSEFRALNLHPILYKDEVPILEIDEKLEEFPNLTFYTKESSWGYEKEWRISGVIKAMPPFPDNLNTNSRVKLKSTISAIIFGEQTPQDIVDIIIKRVKAANSSIEFRRAVWSLSNQELIMKTII